tara:strand:- start:755 stop:1447 length:693 start_codon:yes stop_codon:yes gene_type:complete
MKAYAIVIKDNEVSEHGFKNLVETSLKVNNDFTINKFEAVTPPYVKTTMAEHNIKWNYPWVGTVTDFASGLTKSAYQTKNPDARVACALSHYLLWKTAITLDEPILILEHDAAFVNKIDFDPDKSNMWAIGINNPLGATRRSREFYTTIANHPAWVQPVPTIDKHDIPQGLAGNSAYIMKPQGAQKMIDLVKQFGLWPNDALMCKQLIPRLGVTKKFYTNIQNLKSTTTQ